MNTKQKVQLEWLRDVDHFFDNYALVFPQAAASGLRARLFVVLKELEQLRVHQLCSGPDRSITVRYRQARHALEDDLIAPLVAIARLEVDDARLLKRFRRPRSGPSADALVKLAHGMAMAAEPYEAQFIAAGMPADFRTQMYDRCYEILENRSERCQAQRSASGTTSVIAQLFVEARKLVFCLDGLVRREMAHTPSLRSVWNDVRQLRAMERRAAA